MWGEIEVKRGLKRHARRRTPTINKLIRGALIPLLASSRCKFVFTALTDRRQPLSVETWRWLQSPHKDPTTFLLGPQIAT